MQAGHEECGRDASQAKLPRGQRIETATTAKDSGPRTKQPRCFRRSVALRIRRKLRRARRGGKGGLAGDCQGTRRTWRIGRTREDRTATMRDIGWDMWDMVMGMPAGRKMDEGEG